MSLAKSSVIEEPVLSLTQQKQIKLREFREFLVNKNVLLGYVKCILRFSLFFLNL